MILLGICQRGKNMYKQGIPTKKREAITKKVPAHKAWTQLPPMTANQTRNIYRTTMGTSWCVIVFFFNATLFEFFPIGGFLLYVLFAPRCTEDVLISNICSPSWVDVPYNSSPRS